MRILRATLLVVLLACSVQSVVPAQAPPPQAEAASGKEFSVPEREQFLLKAKVTRTRGVSVGVTGTLRATLTDGTVTHDASIQTVDEYMHKFESNRGVELNFRDTWRFNVAAYRLDRLLELGMIPPSVRRTFNGKDGSFTWWVDDVLMDEGARMKQKRQAPDPRRWNAQMWHVRLFDQLIYNTDRNLGNLLIDNDWTIWMIDHTRAFRLFEEPKTPGNISLVDRRVLERLKALDRPTLDKAMEDYLTGPEVSSLLRRRDAIVALVEKRKAVFEWERPSRPLP